LKTDTVRFLFSHLLPTLVNHS